MVNSVSQLLTPQQAAGLLQRVMPGRDAAAWLESDRRFQPILPFVLHNGAVRYREEDVCALARKLQADVALRTGQVRRRQGERRQRDQDRRQSGERRSRQRGAALLDRRLMIRPDRRADLDRRIRGWLNRRCIPDRRQPAPG
ncbi:hypothetical protein [Thiobacter aerophilum]|uniref:Uncharacterized protein n=1 Tax=Thiobacter aerophilum TaxID=3121275 RepID=A0ABV0EJV3_9BURK